MEQLSIVCEERNRGSSRWFTRNEKMVYNVPITAREKKEIFVKKSKTCAIKAIKIDNCTPNFGKWIEWER